MTSSRYLIPTVITKFDVYGDNHSQEEDDVSSFHSQSGWSSWEQDEDDSLKLAEQHHPHGDDGRQLQRLRISLQSPPSELKPSTRAFFGLPQSPPFASASRARKKNNNRASSSNSSSRTLDTTLTATSSSRSPEISHADKIKQRLQRTRTNTAETTPSPPPAIARRGRLGRESFFFDERFQTPKATQSLLDDDDDTSAEESDDNETFTSDGGRSITERALLSVLKQQQEAAQNNHGSPSATAPLPQTQSPKRNLTKNIHPKQKPVSRLRQPSPSALTRLRASRSTMSPSASSPPETNKNAVQKIPEGTRSRLRQPSPSRFREKSIERTKSSTSHSAASKTTASSRSGGVTSTKHRHTQTTPRSKMPMRSSSSHVTKEAKSTTPVYLTKHKPSKAPMDSMTKSPLGGTSTSAIRSPLPQQTRSSHAPSSLRVVGVASPRASKGSRSPLTSCGSSSPSHRNNTSKITRDRESPRARQRTWQDLSSEWDSMR